MIRMRNKFLILSAFLLFILQSEAYQVNYVMSQTLTQIGAGSTTIPKIVMGDPSIGLTASTPVYSYKVSLKYTRNQLTDIGGLAPWSYTATINMNFSNANGVLAGSIPAPFTLTINNGLLNNPTSSVYEAVALYDVQNTYINNPNVSLLVTGVGSSGPVPADIILELTQIQTITEPFSPLAPITLNLSNTNTLSWTYVTGAQSYDLQWVYIDSYDQAAFTNQSDPFTYKEPVSISTACQSFNFHNTYSAGTIYFRIRAVNINPTTLVATKGAWNYNGATTVAQVLNIVNASDFESLKNWQTTTVFIENGKYKKNIEFADGSMRGRQSQTSMNSDGTVVISETKYDYEGRPVVNVMPFPYNVSTKMNYVANANVFNSAQVGVFQKSGYDNLTGALALQTTSGASQYYSPSNTFQTNTAAAYIPDAQGYPYSQVVYTPDNTGRIAKKSEVGSAFAIIPNTANPGIPNPNQHFSQKYYATPSSTELYRMFGTNVGNASHYTKTYTVDGNGVVSISYQDPEGKVIATALSELASNNLISVSDPYNQTTLSGTTQSTFRLSHNNTVDPNAHVSISTDKIVNLTAVPVPTYTFNYDLNSSLDPLNGSCLTCEYTLEISITGPDGLSAIPDPVNSGKMLPYYTQDLIPVVTSCSTATYPVMPPLPVPFPQVGEYTVTKKLYYRSGAIQNLTSSILAGTPVQLTLNNVIYTSLASFTTAYINQQEAIANCGLDCPSSCYNYSQTFLNKINPATGVTYTTSDLTAIQNTCLATCSTTVTTVQNSTQKDRCAGYYQQMLLQLSPGGFYYQKSGFLATAVQAAYTINNSAFTGVSGTEPTVLAAVSNTYAAFASGVLCIQLYLRQYK